jgi:hypothetical protein
MIATARTTWLPMQMPAGRERIAPAAAECDEHDAEHLHHHNGGERAEVVEGRHDAGGRDHPERAGPSRLIPLGRLRQPDQGDVRDREHGGAEPEQVARQRIAAHRDR